MIVQERQSGNDSNRLDDDIFVIIDNLLEDHAFLPTEKTLI